MKVDSISHLDGQYECSFRRDFSNDLKSAETATQKQIYVQKRLIKDVLAGDVAFRDIARETEERFEDIPYKSEKGKREVIRDVTKRIKRITRDINGKVMSPVTKWNVVTDPPAMDITIHTDTEDIVVSDVAPDLLITSGQWIYAYRIRTGAPRNSLGRKYTQDNAKTDKQLYVLLQYAREFAKIMSAKDPSCGGYVLQSGYLFLRKGTDRVKTRTDSGHFDPEFFLNENGKYSDNVVEIMDMFDPKNPSAETGMDKAFRPYFNKFLEGIEPEDCTPEKCAECEIYDLHHYSHAPVRLKEEKLGTQIRTIRLSGVQEEIEMFNSGYANVNAGPGAGKTLVLVNRIVRFLNNGVDPSEIVIITFTNSGAEVFKDRIAKYNDEFGTGEPVDEMTATTFNGLGQMILEKEYKMLGFNAPPRVIDDIERSSIIAKLLNENDVPDLDYRNFTTDMMACKGPLAVAKRAFELIKTKQLTVFDAKQIAQEVGLAFCTEEAAKKLALLYDEYDKVLKEKNLVEYADQEVILLEMLKKDPYYFDQFGWKHILVDECQDTSENQFEILKYMTRTTSFESLMVVGDDSQSIYGFRDTSPKFFVDFESTMQLPAGTVKTFYMTDNFRSTPEIIDFANTLIDRNTVKVSKEIFPKNPSGDAVVVKGFIDQEEEYKYVLEEIKKEIEKGTPHENIAFIASNRTELMKMASILAEAEIPCVMLNPERYLENSRVRAGLALARFFQNRSDTKDCMIYLNALFGGELTMLSPDEIRVAVKKKQEEAKEVYSLPEKEFKTKYFEMLRAIDEDDEIFESFVDTLEHQPRMSDVLAYCNDFELYGEKAERRREHSYPGVVLTTAHSSKGMEWPVVFHSISRFDTEDLDCSNTSEKVEEKRRLLFVAATRAREKLVITGVFVSRGGLKDPHYNRFLKECYDITGQDMDAGKIAAQMVQKRELKKKERERKKQEDREKFIREIKEELSKEKSSDPVFA